MGKQMVIVESPSKAKTIAQIIGDDYLVSASLGHIRDLPGKEMGVDIENNFIPTYVVIPGKEGVIEKLKKQCRMANKIWLATDPDREGEAIAWHITETLKREIRGKEILRVEFHEITPQAIRSAFQSPRRLNYNIVNAQQARRILDRLVGYILSPLLGKNLGNRHLSAGRVQSVALRLIVERDRAIRAFVPREYWLIDVRVMRPDFVGDPFMARLYRVRGKKPIIREEPQAQRTVKLLDQAKYLVRSFRSVRRPRRPPPPFTTSTLQQAANHKLGCSVEQTMRIAQQLYEGLPVNGAHVGLITYMRTDSTAVSEVAIQEARKYIAEYIGEEFLPKNPRVFKDARNAQGAHEAIRPTSVFRTPDALASSLNQEQLAIYRIIWDRFLASQMSDAIYDVAVVDIEGLCDVDQAIQILGINAENADFTDIPELGDESGEKDELSPQSHAIDGVWLRARGQNLVFPGYLRLYQDNDEEAQAGESSGTIPPLEKDLALIKNGVQSRQNFTKPPHFYTEATIVKALEKNGIGRPSTYAQILSNLFARKYIYSDGKKLRSTEIGEQVTDYLVSNFSQYMDVGFTSRMESALDAVESGERNWVDLLADFYGPFISTVEQAMSAQHDGAQGNISRLPCPSCQSGYLVQRSGQYGDFLACSRYPTCRFRAPLPVDNMRCPLCGSPLVIRKNPKSPGLEFYGCLAYPKCNYTSPKAQT